LHMQGRDGKCGTQEDKRRAWCRDQDWCEKSTPAGGLHRLTTRARPKNVKKETDKKKREEDKSGGNMKGAAKRKGVKWETLRATTGTEERMGTKEGGVQQGKKARKLIARRGQSLS